MQQTFIKLAYRIVIDHNSTDEAAKKIFNDSWEEFCMQAQAYHNNGALKRFSELKAFNPKANSLHYKVGFAVGLYLEELPEVKNGLTDNFQRIHIPFTAQQFELVESDMTDKSAHRVAVMLTTDELLLLNIIGDRLLLAVGSQQEMIDGPGTETFLVSLQPGLSIMHYRQAYKEGVPGENRFMVSAR